MTRPGTPSTPTGPTGTRRRTQRIINFVETPVEQDHVQITTFALKDLGRIQIMTTPTLIRLVGAFCVHFV